VDNFEIGSDSPAIVPDAVCFETGATRAQAADPELWVYEHHGEGFGWADPGALTCFFDDLIHGRPMPPKFVTKAVDIDVLAALTLHRNPSITVCPNALKLVTAVDLVHRRGAVGMAHVEPELHTFIRFLREYGRLRLFDKATDYIRDYITNDTLPQMGREPDPPTILDTGSRGFVVAETQGSLGEAWVHLFRSGFTRGIVLGPDRAGRRHVLGGRKGPFVDLKLDVAARLFNEVERSMGELPEWKTDALWLYSPLDGTPMLVSHMLQILVRV
jgi:hypothetical protein